MINFNQNLKALTLKLQQNVGGNVPLAIKPVHIFLAANIFEMKPTGFS